MRAYEFMFILDPTLDDAASLAVVERVEEIITAREGVVVSLKPWERRRLAYPIDGHHEGLYMLCYFDARPEAISEIERRVRLAEGVLRFLILKIDEATRERDQEADRKRREDRAAAAAAAAAEEAERQAEQERQAAEAAAAEPEEAAEEASEPSPEPEPEPETTEDPKKDQDS